MESVAFRVKSDKLEVTGKEVTPSRLVTIGEDFNPAADKEEFV
jgi:hypothetical protein